MANEPAPEIPAGSPVRPHVQPTAAGMARPAVAANVVSIGQEVTGFLVTFYSVPADVLEAPAVKQQIREQQEKPAGSVINVTVELDPAAKLFLPITTVAGLVQLLSEHLRAWNNTYARELRGFLDNAKPRSEPADKGTK